MKEYLRVREKQEKTSRVIGITLAVAIPACAAILCSFTGFKYIWPPPQENAFLIDYTEEIEEVIQHRDGSLPQAEEIDLSRPVELVQKSESPITANTSENLSSGTPDDHGDVEIPAPKESEINRNALFPGMSKKDTSVTAPHSASEASEGFKAGQPSGNTDKGQTEGSANAHLKGRNVIGTLPRPSYSIQEEGIVVVTVWVDNYGNVTKALAGADGTTVTSTELWTAARNAAMKAHFNQKADAPALQQGTITYIFSLK